MNHPTAIPVMLDVAGRRCVIVGGGGVALRRAKSLSDAGGHVVVVAPELDPGFTQCQVELRQKPFEASDLGDAFLVVVATDNPAVNDQVQAAAASAAGNVLVNRADEADRGNLTFMTTHRDGPLTVAVHTGGASAAAAVQLREELAKHIDPDLPRLLTLALKARSQIQSEVADPAKRMPMLRRLTDDQAIETLKTGGKSALQSLYADIIKGSAK